MGCDYEYSYGSHTTGTDIEFVLVDDKGNYRAAIPYIKGDKKEPQWIEAGNVQKDNVAMEVAVDYAWNRRQFVYNTAVVISQLYSEFIPNGWNIEALPSAMFPDEELTDPIAQEFGCDPDFDAKSCKTNQMDLTNVHPNFRSFGLHVHTGYADLRKMEDAQIYIMASDVTLGLFSTIVDNSEPALKRRDLYGKPSAFRMKSYGVEYRTLSNFWVKSPQNLEAIYILNDFTMWLKMNLREMKHLFRSYDMENISNIIKTGDKASAYEIFGKEVYPRLVEDDQALLDTVMSRDLDSYGSVLKEWSEEIAIYRRGTQHEIDLDLVAKYIAQ
jgi:hypothetical protein